MAKHRIVCDESVLGKGLHCVLIRAANTVRVREGFQEELFQQSTVFHDGICHTCFDAQTASFDELCRGKSPTCLQPGRKRLLFRHPLCGDTPQRPAMEMALRLEGCR